MHNQNICLIEKPLGISFIRSAFYISSSLNPVKFKIHDSYQTSEQI